MCDAMWKNMWPDEHVENSQKSHKHVVHKDRYSMWLQTFLYSSVVMLDIQWKERWRYYDSK